MPATLAMLHEIFDCLRKYPAQIPPASTKQGKCLLRLLQSGDTAMREVESEDIQYLLARYTQARALPQVKAMRTTPDPVVSLVMDILFQRGDPDSMKIHRQAMQAENLVGALLESYLASKLEPKDWIWCAGEMVRYGDFIKREGNTWKVLQVKNRSNSENSASRSVRDSTSILRWYRVNAQSGRTRWEKFPDVGLEESLSEDDFRSYISIMLSPMPR